MGLINPQFQQKHQSKQVLEVKVSIIEDEVYEFLDKA